MSVIIEDHVFETVRLHEEEGPRLMWALIDYVERGIEPDPSEEWYKTFFALHPYVKERTEASRNGAKGGRPKKTRDEETPLSEVSENGFKTLSESSETPLKNPVSEAAINTINTSTKEKNKNIKFTPPTTEEVEAYCEEWGHTIDAGAFVDFYASKGWKVGSAPMKDWRAAVRNWWRTDHKRGQDPLNAKPGKYAKFGV